MISWRSVTQRMTPLFLLWCMFTIVTVIQIFPIASIPVGSIRLSKYRRFEYGIWGWCFHDFDDNGFFSKKCTKVRIGFKPVDTSVGSSTLKLPSESKYEVSKLLVVHLICLGVSGIIWGGLSLGFTSRYIRNNTTFILIGAILAMTDFLLTLLSFLVDLMLFSVWLNWPGWLMLFATTLLAICGSMLWSFRRAVILQFDPLMIPFDQDTNNINSLNNLNNLNNTIPKNFHNDNELDEFAESDDDMTNNSTQSIELTDYKNQISNETTYGSSYQDPHQTSQSLQIPSQAHAL